MTNSLMGEAWFSVLQQELQQPYFSHLKETLRAEYKTARIYPKPEQILRAYQLTNPSKSLSIATMKESGVSNLVILTASSTSILSISCTFQCSHKYT